jgi:hypothetical protein
MHATLCQEKIITRRVLIRLATVSALALAGLVHAGEVVSLTSSTGLKLTGTPGGIHVSDSGSVNDGVCHQWLCQDCAGWRTAHCLRIGDKLR